MRQIHLDLYKQLYYDEIAMRDRIWNMLTAYLTVLPLIIAGLAYFTDKIGDIKNIFLKVYCLTLIIAIIFVLGYSVYSLIKSLFGYSYQYIASPKILEEHADRLQNYYGNSFNEEQMLNNALYENYRDFTHHNGGLNILRMNRISMAFKSLSIALIISGFLAIPYMFFKNDSVNKVELVNTSSTTVGGVTYGGK